MLVFPGESNYMWLSCALTAEGHSTDDACAVEMEKWKSLNLSDAERGR